MSALHLNDDNFQEIIDKAKEDGQPVFVDFMQNGVDHVKWLLQL